MSIVATDIALATRLRGVTAAFEPGQVTAICGPNGAGKSTLLSIMAGLLRPDSGGAALNGADVHAMPHRTRARAIGYLPQNGPVAWDVSVRNLVGLGRLPFGDTDSDAVAAALAAMELHALADRPVSRLSGGERARALLARVLAGEPRWLLVDEPLAALDIAHRRGLLTHLRRIADTGVGVIVVMHDLAAAMNHADRALVLDDGACAAFGEPWDALDEATIARVWNAPVRWIGEGRARALIDR